MKHRILAGQIVTLALAQGVAMLFPLLSTPYLVRALGVEAFGTMMFMAVISLYLSLVVDYGFNVSGPREVAVLRDDPRQLRGFVATTLYAKAALLGGSAVVVLGASTVVPALHDSFQLILIVVVCLAGNVFFPGWVLQGLEMMRSLALAMALPRLLALVAMILFVQGPSDVGRALFLLLSPTAGAALVGWVLLARRNIRPSGASSREVLRALRTGSSAFVASVSSGVQMHSGAIALQMVRGANDVAYFTSGTRVLAAVKSVVVPAQMALLPRIATAFREGAPALARWQRISFALLVIPHVLLGVLLFAFSDSLVVWYLGDKMLGAVPVVRWLALATVLAGIEVWAYTMLVAIGKVTQAARPYLTAAAFHLALILPASAQWGATGAAATGVVSQAVLAGYLAGLLKRSPRASDADSIED